MVFGVLGEGLVQLLELALGDVTAVLRVIGGWLVGGGESGCDLALWDATPVLGGRSGLFSGWR